MAPIVEALRAHTVVGIDTSLFIYHLEGTSGWAESVASVFEEMAEGSFQGVTSTVTLMELAVRPLQEGRPDIADEYEVILDNYPHLSIVPIDGDAARTAAELRALHRLRPADALQIAVCLRAGATAFLSNDRALRRIDEIQVLLLDDLQNS